MNLKFFLLNAENLFLMSDLPLTQDQLLLPEPAWKKLSTSLYPNKSLWKLRGLVRAIEEENPDILLLCEVGGEESLSNFARHFLGDRYSPALVEGNSDRNIDVGFLVRKDLGVYFDVVSNKNFILDLVYTRERAQSIKPPHHFSRDAIEISFFWKDPTRPFLSILHTHLKSHLDPDGIDPDGYERRASEFRGLMTLYKKMKAKHPRPVLVTGDLNGNASREKTDPEFRILYQSTDLKDVCELAGLSPAQRTSFIQLPRHAARQLDYCFVSENGRPYIDRSSVHFHAFKSHLGLPMDPPRIIEDRDRLPSDHYPLVFTMLDLPLEP